MSSSDTSVLGVQSVLDRIRLNTRRPFLGARQPASRSDFLASALPAGAIAALAGARRPPVVPVAPVAPLAAKGAKTAFDPLIQATAQREGVDPALVRSVVQAESNFNPKAISPAGAKGLMQLMDGTARTLGVRDSFDPVQNVSGGVRYLRQMLDRYDGDERLALAAYNAGPGAVDQYRGIPPYAETQQYVKRVLQYRGTPAPPPAETSQTSQTSQTWLTGLSELLGGGDVWSSAWPSAAAGGTAPFALLLAALSGVGTSPRADSLPIYDGMAGALPPTGTAFRSLPLPSTSVGPRSIADLAEALAANWAISRSAPAVARRSANDGTGGTAILGSDLHLAVAGSGVTAAAIRRGDTNNG